MLPLHALRLYTCLVKTLASQMLSDNWCAAERASSLGSKQHAKVHVLVLAVHVQEAAASERAQRGCGRAGASGWH